MKPAPLLSWVVACRSPTSRKGMPQELEEQYYGNDEYTFINASGGAVCVGGFTALALKLGGAGKRVPKRVWR